MMNNIAISAAMDSDDDFGDFTSVPAEALQHNVKDVPRMDVGSSPADRSTIAGATSTTKAVDSNSDDDWGDFVEHSPSADDWFTTTERSPPSEAFPAGGYANNPSTDSKSGFWIGTSEVQMHHAEQKAANSGFGDLHFFAGIHASTSEASLHATDVNNYDIAAQQTTLIADRIVSEQKMETLWKSVNSSPIPLSLFGDTELNAETQPVDSATNVFQAHTRNKAVSDSFLSSGSKELSNLIENLYTESQPLSNAKNAITVPLDELENSTTTVNNFPGYPSSGAGGNLELEKSMLTLDLRLDHASKIGFSKDVICVPAGEELQLQEATTSFRLDALSEADKCSFVEAWASILAVCLSELELASEIWKQAQGAGVHLALLSDLQGKRYFAAIGQIYVVALILDATSIEYKPWLQVAMKNGDTLRADLERCKAVWLETSLKEGVRLALDGLEGLMPTSVVSWKGIERFSTVALEAQLQAARASVHSICKICLLPMAPFSCTGLSLIEWSGSSYFLPLANLWANCVSQKPPIHLSLNLAKAF